MKQKVRELVKEEVESLLEAGVLEPAKNRHHLSYLYSREMERYGLE